MQKGEKLPSFLLDCGAGTAVREQQRLYDERRKLEKERKQMETMKKNCDRHPRISQSREDAVHEVTKNNNRE
jgi:hypothetical protein